MGRIVKDSRVISSYRIPLPPLGTSNSSANEPLDAVGIDAFEREMFGDEFDVPDVIAPAVLTAPDRQALVDELTSLMQDVAHDARALLDRAHVDAIAMIGAARERVVTIENDAKAVGHEQGERDARASVDAEMADMLETMRGLVEMAREERHKIISEAEQEIVRLASSIAERIIHRTIATDDGIVLETVRSAISRITSRERVVVRVNPADLEIIRDHRDRVTAGADIEHLKIVEDQRVDRGGVVVETESGTIDGRISTQLRESHRVLDIDEPIEVRESPEAAVLAEAARAG